MIQLIRDRKIARSFDGMITAAPDGRQFVVYEPAWWQIRRWFVLWRSKEHGVISVTRNGKNYRVYVMARTSVRVPR